MSRYLHLDNTGTYSVVLNGTELKNRTVRKDSMRILGTKVDKFLTWEEHIADVIKASYDTLRSLKLLKRYTPCKLRKTLAEVLMFSKIDYGSAVYQNVPKFLVKRLHLEMISAGYVLNSYAKECDVIKFGWLLIIERFEFNTTKLAFKALHCLEWLRFLPFKLQKSNYRVTLRNSDNYKLPYVKNKNI